jgi:cyclic beta-1,2-glucan synthetase
MFKEFFKKLANPLSTIVFEKPIRDEIFSADRLEEYAIFLAKELEVSTDRRVARSLLPRVENNYLHLVQAYKRLAQSVGKGTAVSPAAEWLVDNFHIIEDQIREIREDLPVGYYRDLPKVAKGDLTGFPRVYAMALTLIAHLDSYLDVETIKRFATKFQTVHPLMIGEIWAIPIALRVALVENLRRLANQTVLSQEVKEQADQFADQLLEVAEHSIADLQPLIGQIPKMLGHSEIADCAFIAQLSKRLRDQIPEVMAACECLEGYLARQGTTTEAIVHCAHQHEAAAQLSIGNIIGSMRLLSNVNWQDFFESVNPIDPILRLDPLDSYGAMDFASRDRYRHAIERIAKRTKTKETAVAAAALQMAEAAAAERTEPRQHHIGYYLAEAGVWKLEKKFNYRPSLKEQVRRLILAHPTLIYLGVLILLTTGFLVPILYYAQWLGAQPWVLLLIGAAALTPISDSCFSLLNLVISRIVEPRILPKLNLENGIPNEGRTLVVVPTMLASRAWVSKMIEGLEVRFLANQDPNLYFALLSDFTDGTASAMPGDVELIEFAQRGIEELNRRYGAEGDHHRFYLFHRKRLWNPNEGKWIGWERKRGKLHEFNRYLRGDKTTSFVIAPNSPEFLSTFRYVITLDSDTQLPRESARRLIGTILHPFNQPQLDPVRRRVTAGYGILQPRISITPESSGKTRFARIFSGHTGIDPYTTAVSDVYQDLFGEGIYTGKGLYVIDAFEAALRGRVPENTLLSHDLFEGLFARTALVTDIEFLDDYPSHYEAFAKRQHRWTRGDWQLLQWLFSGLKSIPFISRWKIIDNLRRSLIAPMTLLWLILGWTILPGAAGIWTLAALVILAIPPLVHTTNQFLLHPRGIPWTSHFWTVWGDMRTKTAQVALSIVCLAHQAYMQTDAILRALFRSFVSRRNLLQWVVASEEELRLKRQDGISGQILWPPLLIALSLILLVLLIRPEALGPAFPFIVAWLAFPITVRWISQSKPERGKGLEANDLEICRHVARRTWHFFETFVGPEDNWLPPDNFQDDPAPMVAHRTSPTNMGLLLMSSCSAYDLGYIPVSDLIERLEQTLGTMMRLEKRFGHFFNWYDTKTLKPLWPEYISTVDSGNLAGHLIAVKQACLEVSNGAVVCSQLAPGLVDTLKIAKEKIATRGDDPAPQKELIGIVDQVIGRLAVPPGHSIKAWRELLAEISSNLTAAQNLMGESSDSSQTNWLRSAAQMVKSNQNLLSSLAPWTELVEQCSGILAKRADRLYLEWQSVAQSLDEIKPLRAWKQSLLGLLVKLNDLEVRITKSRSGAFDELAPKFKEMRAAILRSINFCKDLRQRSDQLAVSCHELTMAMDFSFLFDKQRKVFPIGFNVQAGARDNSFYDLLASEARLTSFVSIIKGDVPQSHWFHLGRQMTSLYNQRVLISWSASMFEYLMPLLVMRDFPSTLLAETHEAVIKLQILHARRRGVPWGVSESGYNSRDLQMNYQYGPFGVPGMGLKRGLSDDQVVSPYSTALACMVSPAEAVINFRQFINTGLLTDYGFYEAIDYTENRVPPGQKMAVIRNYLAHHQGMILVALNNVLNDGIIQDRFHRDPAVQSSELLLQERIPARVEIFHPRAEEVHAEKVGFYKVESPFRQLKSLNTLTPRTHILSNGNYTVMVSASGSGFSRCGNVAVSRWRNDPTLDPLGTFFYIHDHLTDATWSAALQPKPPAPDSYRVTFSEHKAEFWRQDSDLVTHTEIIVSAKENIELRRLTITNLSEHRRQLEVTSYVEPILTSPEADLAHPAFSNLFVQTKFIRSRSALLAHRRKRSSLDPDFWGIHTVTHENGELDPNLEFETDRARFLGRNRTPSSPQAIDDEVSLSNFSGLALDPLFSLRTRVVVEPHSTIKICFMTGLAPSREEALRLIDQYHDPHAFRREDEMAWTRAQVELRHLGIKPEDIHIYQDLASALLYPCGVLRPASHILELNTKPQSGLWPFGISGDLPILLAEVTADRDLPIVKHLLHAHEYLRLKGITWDLVLFCGEKTDYRMALYEELMRQVRMSSANQLFNKSGGIFVIRKDSVAPADANLLLSAARVFIHSGRGTLKEQINRLKIRVERQSPKLKLAAAPLKEWKSIPLDIPKFTFANGFGGFTPDGREYVIHWREGHGTPLPWVNVIANEKEFGFLVSEYGSGFTWSRNSRENRITPWSNDPVMDPPGEVFYLRDGTTGEVWSPTPGPSPAKESYLIRHGQGYTIFEHISHELKQHLTMSVAPQDEIKICRLKIQNLSSGPRKISLVYYLEWVLGFHRTQTAHGLITGRGSSPNVFWARNPLNNEFGGRVAFAATNREVASFTCDRREFLGRHGSYRRAQGLELKDWGAKVGGGLDPCLAMRIELHLQPGEEQEAIFLLGQAPSSNEIPDLVKRFTATSEVEQALVQTKSYWDHILGAIEIKTPFQQLDILVNRWLLYQALSCRIWARSATYQSSGAYGFRDQLQDVMALVHARPDLTKEQILRAAAHQFPEGDVLHWWHPPSDRGVRTHFSDDLLWLPFVVHHYIEATGDKTILDAHVPFVEGPLLSPEHEDIYIQPQRGQATATIYEHCLRAIDRSLKVGGHGLPLMGCGDWNDGMNRVGYQGKGESVWMAWFLGSILRTFVKYCERRNDAERVTTYHSHLRLLKEAVETTGWDGEWYRRAYFDDGTPLGSKTNDECKIDSIAQSWAALSGIADQEHLRLALNSADQHLVRRKEMIILLFTPPFDKTTLDPGYIKGYVPGIRENGAQYTHGAIWLTMAHAQVGDGDRALELALLLNPINHSSSEKSAKIYQVEPYIVPADIYSVPPHVGRGGWTWYTGSASWYYRAITESILGLQRRGQNLDFKPALTGLLDQYAIRYRYGSSIYEIYFQNPSRTTHGRFRITVDGIRLETATIPLKDDGKIHQVRIEVVLEEARDLQT